MTRYIVVRLAQVLLVLFVFLTLVFLLVSAQPGDVADFYALDPGIHPDVRAKVEALFGLDEPLWKQYLLYVRNFLTGDLGVSFSQYPRSVVEVIRERLPRTALLFVTAAVVSFYLGFAMGKSIAWRRGGFAEHAATLGGVGLYTAFTPLLGLMLIWLFTVKLDWLPVGKFLDPVVWLDAPVTANRIFAGLLATGVLVSAFVLVVRSYARRWPAFRGAAGPAAVAVGAVATLVAWKVWGTGYLAVDILRHMVLPVATLTLVSFGGTKLLVRNSMLETMREDYVLAARAKGLPRRS